jgi:uncharacterized membrane protein
MARTTGPTDLERLVFFSDAVFAIAITLLVLPLADAHLDDSDLPGQLLGLWPQLLSYGLSFLVIGTYWVAHHRTFREIVELDATLLGLNLAFLACIALLPFPTAVLGEHGNTTAGVVVYAAAMSVTGFLAATTWAYASRHQRLIDPALELVQVRYLQLRSLVVPVAFLPSIAVAFVNPRAAWFLWLVAYPLVALIRRLAPTSPEDRVSASADAGVVPRTEGGRSAPCPTEADQGAADRGANGALGDR